MDGATTLAYWIVRSRADAEDVVQDAYLRAWRAFAGWRGDDIRPWFYAIVRNVAYRRLSDRQRGSNVISLDVALSGTQDAVPLEIASDVPSAEDLLISADTVAQVRTALADLPPIFREVLVLREIEGMSYREIAVITGTVIGTVMSRLARGREDLREALRAREKEEERRGT